MIFKNDGNDLLEAAKHGDHVKAKKILGKKPDLINVTNNNGLTPINRAAYWGQEATADTLLLFGPDLEIKDNQGDTPLTNALVKGYDRIAGKIVRHKPPRFDYRGSSKEPHLAHAISKKMTETAIALIKAGAPVNESSTNGLTPLMTAIRYGETEVAMTLINHPDIKINASLNDGMNALMYAASGGHLAIVQKLVEAGALLDECGKDRHNKRTALMFAAEAGHRDVVAFLLNAGADKRIAADTYGTTAEKLALASGRTETARLIAGTSTRPVTEAAAAAPKQQDAEDVWKPAGDDKIIHICTYPDAGMKLVDIFNFAALERTTVSEDMVTGVKTPPTTVSFNDVSREAIKQAYEEFKAQGGKVADEEAVLGRKRQLGL